MIFVFIKFYRKKDFLNKENLFEKSDVKKKEINQLIKNVKKRVSLSFITAILLYLAILTLDIFINKGLLISKILIVLLLINLFFIFLFSNNLKVIYKVINEEHRYTKSMIFIINRIRRYNSRLCISYLFISFIIISINLVEMFIN